MLYNSTTNLLRRLLRSLEAAENVGCDDQVEWGAECLFEMHQMARPLYMGSKIDGWPSQVAPVYERSARAIPHVKSMVRAIRRKNQAAAIASCNAALAEL